MFNALPVSARFNLTSDKRLWLKSFNSSAVSVFGAMKSSCDVARQRIHQQNGNLSPTKARVCALSPFWWMTKKIGKLFPLPLPSSLGIFHDSLFPNKLRFIFLPFRVERSQTELHSDDERELLIWIFASQSRNEAVPLRLRQGGGKRCRIKL